MKWTAEDDENLRQFSEAGYSAAEAGDHMGRTRNAILGRAHRIGVSFKFIKQKPPISAIVDEPAPEVKPVPEIKPAPEVKTKKTHPPRGSLYESLLELRSDQCRWPLETTFCDDDKLPGYSYCAEHFKLSYRPAWGRS